MGQNNVMVTLVLRRTMVGLLIPDSLTAVPWNTLFLVKRRHAKVYYGKRFEGLDYVYTMVKDKLHVS